MSQNSLELPNIISLAAEHAPNEQVGHFLHFWEDVIFSSMVIVFLVTMSIIASRKMTLIPGKLQNAFEFLVENMLDFLNGILGKHAKILLPFLGTIFIYIFLMNLIGLIPFFKSPTSNLATTASMAICVFLYFFFTYFKEMGVVGFIDHLAGKPRGVLLWTLILPIFLFIMETISIFLRPLTLSLRLRGNIWGEDLILAIVAGFGVPLLPVLFFISILALIAAVVQALVFFLLSTVYFALALHHEDEEHH